MFAWTNITAHNDPQPDPTIPVEVLPGELTRHDLIQAPHTLHAEGHKEQEELEFLLRIPPLFRSKTTPTSKFWQRQQLVPCLPA